MDKNELLLALVRCTFLTCREKEFLAKNLDNLESLTVLSIEDISHAIGRSVNTRLWRPELAPSLVDRDLSQFGTRWVPVLSPDYPPLLRELHDPPFAVFWRGCLPDPELPMVAIVGTRAPSGDGALSAARLAHEFADAGIPVVSGLARGIDAFAHRGALDGRGKTVAVLACGVEEIYPRSNIRLASRAVEAGGCLLGEYPPGEPPLQYRFPQRNRIISGLSRAVIVVEAPTKSGALITADFALEQGRDLFVVRDTLGSLRGDGTRALQADGAVAIGSAREVLDSWGFTPTACDTRAEPGMSAASLPPGLSGPAAVGRQLALDFAKQVRLQ